MQRFIYLAAIWLVVGHQAASAQSPLEELERRLETGRTAPREPGVLGLTADDSGGRGLRVVAVKPGGPAEAAGVRVDDRLIELERKPLRTLDDLSSVLKFRSAGESVGLTIERAGERHVVTARLAGRTGTPLPAAAPVEPRSLPPGGENPPVAELPRELLPPPVENVVPFPRPKSAAPAPNAEAPASRDELEALLRETAELHRRLEDLERRLAELQARLNVEPAKQP